MKAGCRIKARRLVHGRTATRPRGRLRRCGWHTGAHDVSQGWERMVDAMVMIQADSLLQNPAENVDKQPWWLYGRLSGSGSRVL